MGKIVDLTGKTFGAWKVIGLSHNASGVLFWDCQCSCGTKRAVFGGDLKRGGSTNCGCLRDKARAERVTTHGMSKHPAFRTWQQMNQRCHNDQSPWFYLYGGRGIRVAKEWRESFKAFWAHMGASWRPGRSIDRIDVNGHYEPGNCRWATPRAQANNRRTNTLIDTPLGRMTVTEAAKLFGISPYTVFARIRYGWAEDKLLQEVRKRKRR